MWLKTLNQRLTGTMTNSKSKIISTGYTPRPLQAEVHRTLRRFNVLVCHRRFGKTVLAINQMIHQSLANPLRNPQYAYIAPTYRQAKRIAWQYYKDYMRAIPGLKDNISELTLYLPRPGRKCPKTGLSDPDVIKIMLIGADDPDDIKGLYLDGVILDEFAKQDPMVWGEVVRPALADRKKIAEELGFFLEPWAIFIGTPKGQNHFFDRHEHAKKAMLFAQHFERNNIVPELAKKYFHMEKKLGIDSSISEVQMREIYKKMGEHDAVQYKAWRKYKISLSWFTNIYKASETGVLALEEIEEMKEDLSPEEIDQELECDFSAAILGSYYGHILVRIRKQERITNVPFNPKYPVDTFWDLGMSDKMAIWFRQKVGPNWHYIDYYENNGKGIDFYHSLLEAKACSWATRREIDSGEFVQGRGFRYGKHIWPHDGAVRELGTGQSRQETARSLGLIVQLQARQAKPDQIQASRNRLKISFFDKKNCDRGLKCLYNYQKLYDNKAKVFKDTPHKDWSGHGADAFAVSALDDHPGTFLHNRESGRQLYADSEYNELAG